MRGLRWTKSWINCGSLSTKPPRPRVLQPHRHQDPRRLAHQKRKRARRAASDRPRQKSALSLLCGNKSGRAERAAPHLSHRGSLRPAHPPVNCIHTSLALCFRSAEKDAKSRCHWHRTSRVMPTAVDWLWTWDSAAVQFGSRRGLNRFPDRSPRACRGASSRDISCSQSCPADGSWK